MWHSTYRRLGWYNGLQARLTKLHEWVRVSLGASFIRPCATSKQKALQLMTYSISHFAGKRPLLLNSKPNWNYEDCKGTQGYFTCFTHWQGLYGRDETQAFIHVAGARSPVLIFKSQHYFPTRIDTPGGETSHLWNKPRGWILILFEDQLTETANNGGFKNRQPQTFLHTELKSKQNILALVLKHGKFCFLFNQIFVKPDFL